MDNGKCKIKFLRYLFVFHFALPNNYPFSIINYQLTKLMNNTSFSRIIGILAFIATILSAVAGMLEQLNPKYAVVLMAVSGAISAFTHKIQSATN